MSRRKAVRAARWRKHPPKAPKARPSSPPPAAASKREEAAPQQSRPARQKSSLEVRPLHLLLFAAVLMLTVGGAVWLSRPDLLRLEAVAEPEEESVQTFGRGLQGPLEVAGIRAYYTDDYQTKVKAFVVNHSDEARSVARCASLCATGKPPTMRRRARRIRPCSAAAAGRAWVVRNRHGSRCPGIAAKPAPLAGNARRYRRQVNPVPRRGARKRRRFATLV